MSWHINFKNCVIILTGNIGSSIAKGNVGVGFSAINDQQNPEEIKDRIKKEVLKKLSPEFINRLDDFIVFKEFNEDNFLKIINLHINDLKLKLRPKGLSIFINKAAKLSLTKEAQLFKDGARPVARVIQKHIVDPLSEKILQNSDKEFKKVKVSYTKKGFQFKFE